MCERRQMNTMLFVFVIMWKDRIGYSIQEMLLTNCSNSVRGTTKENFVIRIMVCLNTFSSNRIHDFSLAAGIMNVNFTKSCLCRASTLKGKSCITEHSVLSWEKSKMYPGECTYEQRKKSSIQYPRGTQIIMCITWSDTNIIHVLFCLSSFQKKKKPHRTDTTNK